MVSSPKTRGPRGYLQDVVTHVIEKGVLAHKKVRSRIAFERFMSCVINNFAAMTSLNDIVGYLKDMGHVSVKSQALSSVSPQPHGVPRDRQQPPLRALMT
ncbi:MAG: hypothetical protein ACFNLW_11845 [Olsenella sp.]